MVGGEGKGSILDGTPGKDAYYTGYHWTKAMCDTCGTLNSNGSISGYGFNRNVYNLYDCAAEFMEKLPDTVSYEYTDSTYHTVTTKGGEFCVFCFGTRHTNTSKLERHNTATEILPQPAHGRFATVEHCSLCEYADYDYTTAKAVIADYYGVVDGKPHTGVYHDWRLYMAVSKSAKIQAEMEKIKAKIAEQQTRLKELEQKHREAENEEMKN